MLLHECMQLLLGSWLGEQNLHLRLAIFVREEQQSSRHLVKLKIIPAEPENQC